MNRIQKELLDIVEEQYDYVVRTDKTKEDLDGILGYCDYKSYMDRYLIRIAKDIPKNIFEIVYIHECGHIYFEHMTVDHKEQFKIIKDKFMKKNPQVKRVINGDSTWHKIENIAMDLEINTQLLSIVDLKTMKDYGYEVYHKSYKDVPPGLKFQEYYDYIIDKVQINNSSSDGAVKCKLPSDSEDPSSSGFDGDVKETKSYSQDEDKKIDGGKQWKDAKDKADQDKYQNQKSYSLDGTADTIIGNGEVNRSLEDIIKDFLGIDKVIKYNYYPDSIKLYNRGTRGKSNILYSSMKRKRYRQLVKSKINVIVDVSGSMDLNLVENVIETVVKLDKGLSMDNRLILYSTRLVNDVPLNLSTRSDLMHGGGTDMASALKYAKGIGLEEVILISDMATNISEFNKELDGITCNVIWTPYECNAKIKGFKNIKEWK